VSAAEEVSGRKVRQGSDRGRGMRPDGRSRRTDDPFVRVSLRLLDAPAFKALAPAARTVLLLVMARWRGDPATNGELPFAARDAEPWGVKRSVANEALAELTAFGFLRCTRPAALLGRRARRWACSELPTLDGRGRVVAPSLAARRLPQDAVDRIAGEVAEARRAARTARDPHSLARLLRDASRPATRTQVSRHADANRPDLGPEAVASPHADAKAESARVPRPATRTVSRSAMASLMEQPVGPHASATPHAPPRPTSGAARPPTSACRSATRPRPAEGQQPSDREVLLTAADACEPGAPPRRPCQDAPALAEAAAPALRVAPRGAGAAGERRDMPKHARCHGPVRLTREQSSGGEDVTHDAG
jgi:hypothetical protein